MNHQQKGFTLIEILAVVAVVGILASIVVVNMPGIEKQAKESIERSENCWTGEEWESGITREQCREKMALVTKQNQDRREKAEAVGCESWRESYCFADKTGKTFGWSYYIKDWQETEASKRCSQYLNSKVSDLPVSCLEYWKVR